MSHNPESIIQAAIEAAIGALPGVVCWRNNVGRADHVNNTTGEIDRIPYGVGGKGSPDLFCEVEIVPGCGVWLAVWMEVKTATGAYTANQKRWHAAAARLHRMVYTVRSPADALNAIVDARGRAMAWKHGA